MSEVRHQLLITLVHGTWPRGFFPRLVRFKKWVRELRGQSSEPPPFWFEEGSSFLTRLTTELGDISHKITPLLWTGENSISERDKTAHVLAKHLSAEHAQHPQATQLVIAHSHGGNIALRALRHLPKRDASQLCGAESANPLVVTLATPFIEVHQADFGRRPFYVRVAMMLFLISPILGLLLAAFLWLILALLFPQLLENNITVQISAKTVIVASLLLSVLMGWWWIVRRASARQNKLDALKNATRLSELGSAQRLLVIRAIDDEASLTLALGAILNYVAARSITFVLLSYFVLMMPVTLLVVDKQLVSWLPEKALRLVFLGCVFLTPMLFGMLLVSRSVHGRELAVSPMECQINTQSAPDAKGLSEIITLVRRSYVKSLRHGIYDHEDCAKTISDWVHSQLCMPHEVGDSKGTQCIGRA
jgi:pimeloyl-ACP methyl ester carboxylesterase